MPWLLIDLAGLAGLAGLAELAGLAGLAGRLATWPVGQLPAWLAGRQMELSSFGKRSQLGPVFGRACCRSRLMHPMLNAGPPAGNLVAIHPAWGIWPWPAGTSSSWRRSRVRFPPCPCPWWQVYQPSKSAPDRQVG